MVSALKLCFAFLLLFLTYLSPKDVFADWNTDFIPPSIVTYADCPNGGLCRGSITITVTCADGQSGCNFTNYNINNTVNRFSGSSIQETKSDPGTYTIRASGYDNAGNLGTANVYTFTIRQPDPPLNVSCSASPNPAPTYNYIYWTANPSGGNGSYSYNWSITDGYGGYGQQIWTVHGSTGTKTANLTVYSGNQTKSATCSVQVENPPPPPPPTAFRINSSSTQCEGGRPTIDIGWTRSENANYGYYIYRQGHDPSSGQWMTKYVGYASQGTYSFKDYDFSSSNTSAYYYYVVAYGVSNPPATTPWTGQINSQNCNQNPSSFRINPVQNFCAGSDNTYPANLVTWDRSSYASWYNIYKYRVNPDNTLTFEYSTSIYDPINYFYDYSVMPGRKYSYYISAINRTAYPGFASASNNPIVSSVTQECNKAVYGYVYLKDTNTSYRGDFTVNSADKVSIYYSGYGYYYQVLTPVPKGGRSYYALYLYPPSGYKITSAPFSYGCGNDRTNIFPCSSIIYSNPESYRFNPYLQVDYYIEPYPTGLNASCRTDGTANLSWNAVPRARAYQVNVDNMRSNGFDCVNASTTGSGDSCIYNVTNTSTNSGSAAGQPYQFSVFSIDSVTGIKSTESAKFPFNCPPPPTVSCTANPTTANIGQQITFTATSQNLAPGQAIDWTGLSDDHGHTGVTVINNHPYASPGTKPVAIRVRDRGGQGNVIAQGDCPVTINPPTNGGWSAWSPVACPTTCGLPASTQTRTCTNPAPANGGAACVGSATSACPATAACPVPSTNPFIQTTGGDVHSNTKIETNP